MQQRSGPEKGSQTAGASVNEEILRARQLLVRYYKPQNVTEAIGILEGVVKQNPNLALGHAALCAAYYRTGTDARLPETMEKVKGACNQAIALDGEMAEPHVTLGLLYLDGGRRDLARSELKKASELDANLPDVHFALAQLYLAEGRKADAEASIQKAIDLAPENWAYRNWRSSEYRNLGRNEEALGELEVALKLLPDNPLVYNNLGVVYLRLRRFEEAEKAFTRANEIEPRPRSLGNLGSTLYYRGEYAKAADAYRRATEMDERGYLSRANYAAALDRLPDQKKESALQYQKAIELAEPLLKATPDDYRLLGNVASYHAVLGHQEQALSLMRRAIALQPQSPDVANRAIAVYEFLKQRDLALEWAARAVKNGYSFETLKNDPELAGLVKDPRFKKVEKANQEKQK
ncbi:MAG: tetratricopeptide repeat protein [Acidobacteria bacterium]|nr:tetratricopeptide repeat protein [Acidobacteriota bacterium]